MGQLTGKCALVTGGARGLGFATAKAFKAEGAKVAVTDRLEAEGARAVASLGDDVVFLAQDVTKPEEWDRVLDQVVARLGAIDILVNNAGIGHFETIETMTFDRWSKTLDVNLNGMFLGTKIGVERMKGRGGSIVNVASIEGMIGDPALPAYNASKGAVRILTKSTAILCARSGYNIRVNARASRRRRWSPMRSLPSANRPQKRRRPRPWPASRWGGLPAPTKLPPPSCSSPRTRRATSPVPIWSSTAA
jgi:3alpha(or 20beta)-hydroxysteroid dehydrogenase